MKVTTEVMREVWVENEPDYEYFEIGPDRDGLGCVEIRMKERKKDEIVERMMIAPEIARHIAEAMIKCANELDENKDS